MASSFEYDINRITPNNLGLRDVSELIFLDILKYGELNEICEVNYSIIDGQIVGGIGKLEPVGTSQNLCNITFNKSKVSTVQKIWKLANLTIAESFCAEDFKDTFIRLGLNKGIKKADMVAIEFFNKVVIPIITQAIKEAIWRVVWFGDTTAKHATDGGNITDTLNIDLMTVCDGLFKRLYDMTATDSRRRTQIAANGQTSKETQKTSIFTKGAAIDVWDRLMIDSPTILKSKADRVVLATSNFIEALNSDVSASFPGSNLHWENLFEGSLSQRAKFRGVSIIQVPIWDSMIETFEDKDATYHDPYRLIHCDKKSLKVAIDTESELADFRYWYNEDEGVNKFKAIGDLGTNLWDEYSNIQFAY